MIARGRSGLQDDGDVQGGNGGGVVSEDDDEDVGQRNDADDHRCDVDGGNQSEICLFLKHLIAIHTFYFVVA